MDIRRRYIYEVTFRAQRPGATSNGPPCGGNEKLTRSPGGSVNGIRNLTLPSISGQGRLLKTIHTLKPTIKANEHLRTDFNIPRISNRSVGKQIGSLTDPISWWILTTHLIRVFCPFARGLEHSSPSRGGSTDWT